MREVAISCDDHAYEPPDCYVQRLPVRFKASAPRVETIDGVDTWVSEGKPLAPAVRSASVVGLPPGERGDFQTTMATFDNIRPAVWKSEKRLEDYDQTDVYGAVLFPDFFAGFANPYFTLGDDFDLRLACVQAYNNWQIEEFCAVDTNRLIANCMVPVWDPEAAAVEVARAAKLGYKGAVFGGSMDQLGFPWLGDKSWNPLWAALQEHDMVLAIHRMGMFADRPTLQIKKDDSASTMAVWGNRLAAGIYPTIELLSSGILEQFPRLRVLLAETGVSWIPFALQQADRGGDQLYAGDSHLTLKASEYFHRQVCAGFWWEQIDPFLLELCGEDNLCWQQDYPHAIGTWPNTENAIDYCLGPIKDERLRRKLLWENIARHYRLDLEGPEHYSARPAAAVSA